MSEMGSMMPMAAPGSSFSFGPIFLSPNDELYFAMTICASMIDCDTATHRFKPAEAEEQTQAQLRQQQQQQQEQMMQQQQQQQVQEQQQLQGQESVRLGLSPRAQSDQQPQPIQQQQQQQQLDACPAIAYTHKLDCGDVTCKVSFVNLSPSKPLDWVDLHVVKADSASLNQLLSIGSTQPHAAALREAQIEQFNYQMTLAAGAQPRMMQHSSASSMMPMRSSVGSQSADRLSNALSLQKFGAASLPESVLAEAGGSQVFQFELPIEFKGGGHNTTHTHDRSSSGGRRTQRGNCHASQAPISAHRGCACLCFLCALPLLAFPCACLCLVCFLVAFCVRVCAVCVLLLC